MKTLHLPFSALFGDKTELSSDISTAFSTSGVSHLIAGVWLACRIHSCNFNFTT